MSAARASFALLLCATACGGPGTVEEQAAPVEAQRDDRISCAWDGATELRRDCTVERSLDDGGLILTVRAPDGGFRRLRVARDGRGVVVADGAVPATVTPVGEREIEVAVGNDRFRLPATVK